MIDVTRSTETWRCMHTLTLMVVHNQLSHVRVSYSRERISSHTDRHLSTGSRFLTEQTQLDKSHSNICFVIFLLVLSTQQYNPRIVIDYLCPVLQHSNTWCYLLLQAKPSDYRIESRLQACYWLEEPPSIDSLKCDVYIL